MTTSKGFWDAPIDPSLLYTAEQIARMWDVDPTTFARKYIHSNELRHFSAFRGVYVIPGWVIIRFIESNLQTWEDETEDTESRPSGPKAGRRSSSDGRTE